MTTTPIECLRPSVEAYSPPIDGCRLSDGNEMR